MKVVKRVPPGEWLLDTWPELETICDRCGERLIFHEFVIKGGEKRAVPSTHGGWCMQKSRDEQIINRDAKEKLKRITEARLKDFLDASAEV